MLHHLGNLLDGFKIKNLFPNIMYHQLIYHKLPFKHDGGQT